MKRRRQSDPGRIINPESAEGRAIAAKIEERTERAAKLAAKFREKPLKGERLLVEPPETDDRKKTVLEEKSAQAVTTVSLDHIKDFKKRLVLYFALKGHYRFN